MRPWITRLEEVYLKIFRLALLVVLTVVLLVILVVGIQGGTKLLATPKPVDPPQEAPTPEVRIDDFIREFDEQSNAKSAQGRQNQSAPTSSNAAASERSIADAMIASHIGKLFGYFDEYQKACSVPAREMVDRQTFDRGFPRRTLQNMLRRYGDAFLQSQAEFEQALLSHPRVIQICIQREGRARIFLPSIAWHGKQWAASVKASEQFARAEAERVDEETYAEQMRVAAAKTEGMQKLTVVFGSIIVFVALALLLIVAKIEINLRGIQAGNNPLFDSRTTSD